MLRVGCVVQLKSIFAIALLSFSSSAMGFLDQHALRPRKIVLVASSAARFATGGGSSSSRSGRGNYGRPRKRSSSTNAPKGKPFLDEGKLREGPVVFPTAPPLTSTIDQKRARPFYFTCRHTYEEVLMQEIKLKGGNKNAKSTINMSSPFPGLVRVEAGRDDVTSSGGENQTLLPLDFDPVYALQTIPDCVIVSAESIKGLSREVSQSLLGKEGGDEDAARITTDTQLHRRQNLRSLPKGSLALHALVPGMFKGQRNPILERRAISIAEELAKSLKKSFAAARKAGSPEGDLSSSKWLLQILLLNPTVAAASLVPCQQMTPRMFWPNWYLPAGLAHVEVDEEHSAKIPSSAFRKLMEAFSCMRRFPSSNAVAIDLGASPGGWTAVLRLLQCQRVYAVDRAELAPNLMRDPRVVFVQGDAFTYQPEWLPRSDGSTTKQIDKIPSETWMVSDIIAYPERIVDLLDQWCGGHWSKFMVVTMKFQGEIAWEDLDRAIASAKRHGYSCRAKHFFNNKNEVTLMVEEIENDL